MPRPSRGRKNRRNRNNKRADNSARYVSDQEKKSASASSDRHGDNSDLESITDKGSPTGIGASIGEREMRDADTDSAIASPEKSSADCSKNENDRDVRKKVVNPRTNSSGRDVEFEVADLIERIGEDSAAQSLTEAKINGHAVKVTTEETTDRQVDDDKGHNVSMIGEFQGCREIESSRSKRGSHVPIAESARRRLRVERRAMNTETKIVEITSLRGNVPLEASIDHVAGVGIIEIGTAGNDEEAGTIVTISEPLEPVRPLPSDVASKVEGLILGKREFNEVTPLATAPRDNNNNDENEPNDGPEIREVSDSDAETDNSINSRPAAGAILVVEAESDVERDSTLDQRSHDTIAEESEDQEDENLTATEDHNELDEIKIPVVICRTAQIERGASQSECEIAEDAKTSARDCPTDCIDITREVSRPLGNNARAIGNRRERDAREEEFQNEDIPEKIPGVNRYPVQLDGENDNRNSREGSEVSKDDQMLGRTSQQLSEPAQVDGDVLKKDSSAVKTVEQCTDIVDTIFSENCAPQELNVGNHGETSEKVVLEEVDASKADQTHPEESSTSQDTLGHGSGDTSGVVKKQQTEEIAEITVEEGGQGDEDDVEEVENSSSVEDDSLEEKFDEVVKANEEMTSENETRLEKNTPEASRDTEARNSLNNMNSLKNILSSDATATSKSSDEADSLAIPVKVEKYLESKESSVTKDVENKLRLFIEGLDLPALNDEPPTTDNRGTETGRNSNESSSQRRAKKRAILDSYYAEAKHADRFLDIIQEEGEKLSECDERNIRDFINEEICKFRREKRDMIKQIESHSTDEPAQDEFTKLEIVPEEESNGDQNIGEFITRTQSENNTTIVHRTMESTHKTEKSMNETRIVVTKKSASEIDAAIGGSANTSHRVDEKTASNMEIHENGIFNGASTENKCIASFGEMAPPVPPKRFSNIISNSEPLQPPPPPDIDYPVGLPEVPALPAELLIGLRHAPIPPQRKKWRQSTDESPKRPPLPKDPCQSNDRIAKERIYENVENLREAADADQDPPPLPPLPRDLQNLETGKIACGSASRSAAIFENFVPVFEYCRENNRANVVGVDPAVASSPETLHREHRRKHGLPNRRPLDEATHGGNDAGNDACFEIAPSVGNRCAYENVSSMPPEAPLSSRKITAPNSRHSDLGRRRSELSNEFSPTVEIYASETVNIVEGKQKSGAVGSEKVGAEDHLTNSAQLGESSDVTLKNDQSANNKVGDTRSDTSKLRREERIVPVEKSSPNFDSKKEKLSKSTYCERSECHSEDFSEIVSIVREERTGERCDSSLDNSTNTNLANSSIVDEKRSIDDSSVTFSEEKPGSRECVENNQAERPKRPPRRQQHSSLSSSASSPSARLLGSKRSETCSSQGQTNSVTTLANKNSVDDEHGILPTLIVTRTLEKNTDSIFRSPSPQRNEVPDDQESSSSGAATPNTVRFNPSDSIADLASLEVREELDKRSTSLGTSDDNKVKAKSSESQVKSDLHYIPIGYEKRPLAGAGTDEVGPDPLKDLCIRRILSLPYGLQLINEITLPEFNIFKSIQAIQESISEIADNPLKNPCSDGATAHTEQDPSSLDEMNQQRRNTWMGVPTMEDPRLLVCLSPSQQKSQVRTSVDNLLDLHKKFHNRRSYHDHDHRDEVDVPRYWVELGAEIRANESTRESRQVQDQRSQESRPPGPGNRLLEIIKENPIEASKQVSFGTATSEIIPSDSRRDCDSRKTSTSRDFREDRLRATRLSDWLSLAREDPQDYSLNREESKGPHAEGEGVESESGRCSKTSSRATRGSSVPQASENDNLSDAAAKHHDRMANREGSSSGAERHQAVSSLVNEVITTRTVIDTSYEKIYDQVISEIEHDSRQIGKRLGDPASRENRLNSALIVKSRPTTSNEEQHGSPTSAHQFDKCPISLKSAIIDKSGVASNETPHKRTPTVNRTRGNIDPRASVNPALIDARSDNHGEQEPIKFTRPIVVDRSCIDTTSIFDKTPPSSRLAPRKYQDTEALKLDTATDIIKNLKLLQSDAQAHDGSSLDGRRRYSLPQESFDRQLHYIEQLENQLREVILAEEEERRAYEEFQGQANRAKCRSMMDLSDHHWEQIAPDRFAERKVNSGPGKSEGNGGKDKVTLDDPNIQRECWHEESRTREGQRSEFTKREGQRLATKSVTDQGDLHVENSSTSYEDRKETLLSSNNGMPNGTADIRDETANRFAAKTSSGDNHERPPDPKCPLKTSKPGTLSPPNGEVFRRKMFDEYVHKVHEREERKQHKVVKLSSHADNRENSSRVLKGPVVDTGMSKMEREFIERARNRMSRFGIKLDESSESEVTTDNERVTKSTAKSSSVNTEAAKNQANCDTAKCLIDGCEIKDPKYLPKHLQEFLELATSNDPVDDARGKTNATDLLLEIDTALKIGKGFLLSEGVWSPGSEPPPPPKQPSPERGKNTEKDAGIPPVWAPSSAGTSPVAERKEFRPVAFDSPVLSRKKFTSQAPSTQAPPWKDEDIKSNASQTVTHNITTRIVNSHSAPSQGLNTLASTPRLPRAQNPTITLLQKAREGQLPKGAAYLEDTEPTVSEIKSHSSPRADPTEIIHKVRREYESEPETTQDRRKKMADPSPRKIEGIGPTTKDGVPVALRSEVKDTNQARWYKKMYDSLHRADKDDDYITVRYKPRRGARYGYGSSSGYLSEPEPRGYSERSATLDTRRRQRNKENDFSTSTMPRKAGLLNSQPEVYRNQPGRIENYEPGRSSIAERETKEWWDEVMDIFDGWLDENGSVRSDRRVDNERLAIPPLDMSHQASRVLSLPYRSDSSDSVSLLSPLTTSRPAKSPESASSSRMVQRLIGIERYANDSSTTRLHKLATDRPSTSPISIAIPCTPKQSRTNPVPHSLILGPSAKSLITSTMERSRHGLASSPIKADDRRIHSMTYAGRNARKANVIGVSTIGREDPSSFRSGERVDKEKDRIIRPLANPNHRHRHTRHPVMLEGKSKSFVLPDRDSRIAQRTLAPPTGSQSNLANIGTMTERPSLSTGSLTSNDDQREYENQHRHRHHHNHHHHHHLNHQRQRRLPISNTTVTSTTASTTTTTNTTPSSSSSSCTSSTNHNATLLPSSMPTIANIITAKNPQCAAPSRPFDQRNSQTPKPYMSHALKESGYESDSTLIFRRRDDASPLSPLEQRLAYKTIQKGGDVPLHGLRKLAPERPKDDTEIEYFPISPTLTRIRVRRRSSTAITRTQKTSMSSSSMTLARYKRTAPSASGNSPSSPRRLATAPRKGARAVRASSSVTIRSPTRANSPPPGRPSTRASSPTPPLPPRRRSSRQNSTLRTLFANNRTPERSSSCPDHGPCPTSRRHEQCFAAESASNIRFLRERLSSKLSEQVRDRESARKYLGSARSSSTSPSSVARSKATTPPKAVPLELPKRSSELCSTKRSRDSSTSPARRNILPTARSVAAIRRVSKSASPVGRNVQELVQQRKTGEVKPPLEKVSPRSCPASRRTVPNGLANLEKKSRQNGRPKASSTSGLKAEQRKACRTKKEPSEGLRRFSSSSSQLVSSTDIKKGPPKQGERDFGLRATTGSNVVRKVTTSPGYSGQKSVESKSVKSVSARLPKSAPSVGTSSRDTLTSSKHLASSGLGNLRRNPCEASSSSLTGRSKRSTIRDVRISTSDSSVVAASDSCGRKRPREKLQTIVKQPPKTPMTIEVHPQERRRDTAKGPMGREIRREPSRSKKLEGNVDLDNRRSKKVPSTKAPVGRDKRPQKNTRKELETQALSMERIKEHQQATRTDKFFQNLFLRNLPSPVPSQSSTVRRSSVMERARMFQECTTDHFKSEPSLRSLSVYLAHKRPVSNSRFKNWERESISSRSSSPYGVSWPGRSVFRKVSKFDSLLGMNEYGSSASLRGRSPSSMTHECPKERSLSEPPLRINCSQDAREAERVASPTARNASPSPTRSAASRRIKSLKQHDKQDVYPSKTRIRSASEAEDPDRNRSNFGSSLSLAKSTGSLESPPLNRDDYQRYLLQTLHVRRKSERYRELHDFYASLERMGELERTTSASDLRPRLKDEEIIDYDRWKEIRSKERAELELREIYGKLKNVQRDKDFLFSTRDLDKYKWRGDRGLRCKDRSVENIRESFRRLEKEESELESTRRREMDSRKDVYKPLWRGNSVANVASNMTRRVARKVEDHDRSSAQPTLQKHLGGSKKFWSSLSVEQVTTLKNQLNEIYGNDVNGKPKTPQAPAKSVAEKSTVNQERSVQIPQQRDIIPQASDPSNKYEIVVPPEEEFGEGLDEKKGLHVRCHSMLTTPAIAKGSEVSSEGSFTGPSSSFKRRGSIGNGRNLESQKTEGPVPISTPLSETEKKRLSLTLGKEILDKVTRMRASTTPVTPRETRGAIAVAPLNPRSSSGSTSVANTSPRTCYSLETSFDDESPRTREKSDFLLVLTPNDKTSVSKRRVENVLDEWSRKPPHLAMSLPTGNSAKVATTSGSEIDSATESSETSVRTVVRRGSEAELVTRKVEFFEKIERTGKSTDANKTTDERLVRSSFGRLAPEVEVDQTKWKKTKLSSAQSFADLKELFGEVESARYTSLASRSIDRTRSTSPDSDRPPAGSGSGHGERSASVSPEVTRQRASSDWNSSSFGFQCRDLDRARSVSPCPISESTCSLESSRNRSVSPDPERYWRAYLNLVKNGSVRKLRAKFESLEELTGDRAKFVPTPKRFQSDPELTRNLLKRVTTESKCRFKSGETTDVAWLRRKYEPTTTTRGRARRRTARSPPIPRIPLRLEDLSMPRINVISKTAELKDNRPRSGSTDSVARRAETEELEAKKPVGRIREKFERYGGKFDPNGESSLLGEMFTSAPNVHELRDIAPYLAGRWVAHEYPNRRDNARSLSLPPNFETSTLDTSKFVEIVKPRKSRTKIGTKKSEIKRNRENRESSPASSSPARPRTPTSILKQPQADPFADQTFDPSKHRPRYRYQPPPPPPPPPVTIFRRDTRSWWPPIPTYTAKPSVTFEGPNSFQY